MTQGMQNDLCRLQAAADPLHSIPKVQDCELRELLTAAPGLVLLRISWDAHALGGKISY